MSAETRARVAAAGGRARAAGMSTEDRQRAGRAGAAAIGSLPGLARRLVDRWAAGTDRERAAAREILEELQP